MVGAPLPNTRITSPAVIRCWRSVVISLLDSAVAHNAMMALPLPKSVTWTNGVPAAASAAVVAKPRSVSTVVRLLGTAPSDAGA